ncbi:MAG: hypothetical protein JWQ96_1994 [Segetibacter sp.]|nr:hypothetical protein [Segetibacter sp.]
MKTTLRFLNFFIAAFMVVVFTRCKDDTVTPTTPNFSPVSANSTWTYRNENNSTYTLTATNRDTTINTKTYRVFTNSSGGFQYMGKSVDSYYRFGIIAAIGGTGTEELYLKDNLAVNGTWSDTKQVTIPNFGPVNANLGYTIKSKGGTKVVSGRTFNNVVHVKLDISVSGLGIGGGDFYYAEGVGMIENAISITVPGQPAVNTSQVLIQYEIK